MKITFILNNIAWKSEADKLQSIRDFFLPSIDLNLNIIHSSFRNLPWVPVGVIGGVTNTPGSTTTIDSAWYSKNISVLDENADILVLCLAQSDIPIGHTSVGIMQGKYGNSVQCCLFGLNEKDDAYVNGVDLGNTFVLFAEHEIAHALYLLQGKKDNTHEYFYSGHPEKVVPELKQTSITQTLLTACLKLLGLYKQEQSMLQHAPQINQWAKCIEKAEGNAAYLCNPGSLKVSSLTQSWGAKNGVQASDGGYIAEFDTYAQGFQALMNFLTLGAENQLLAFHQARTLESFTKIYAGNPPQGYIDSIISGMGVPGNTDISTFL